MNFSLLFIWPIDTEKREHTPYPLSKRGKDTKAARQATDDAYRAAVKRLNALAEVNGDADYIDVINAMNTLIDRQTAILKARATKSANKRKKEEDTTQA